MYVYWLIHVTTSNLSMCKYMYLLDISNQKFDYMGSYVGFTMTCSYIFGMNTPHLVKYQKSFLQKGPTLYVIKQQNSLF